MYGNNEDLKNKSKKIQMELYCQTTNYTCVASSYLMNLNHFFPKVFTLDKETEMNIHNKIKFWEGGEGEYGSYPKLAKHALNLGLEVHMKLSGLRKPKFIPKEIWDKYMENFLPIIDELKGHPRFQFEEEDFNLINLLNDIDREYIPIVEINYPTPETTHHVVVRGHKGKKIKVLDPIAGFSSYNVEDFDKLTNLGYMKNFISLKKPNKLELELIAQGLGASKGDSLGKAQIINGYHQNFQAGDILIAPRTDPDMTPNMIISSGMITDQGGMLCHAAIVAREIGIPAIVGTRNASSQIQNGDNLYLDGDSGRVYRFIENEKRL